MHSIVKEKVRHLRDNDSEKPGDINRECATFAPSSFLPFRVSSQLATVSILIHYYHYT